MNVRKEIKEACAGGCKMYFGLASLEDAAEPIIFDVAELDFKNQKPVSEVLFHFFSTVYGQFKTRDQMTDDQESYYNTCVSMHTNFVAIPKKKVCEWRERDEKEQIDFQESYRKARKIESEKEKI